MAALSTDRRGFVRRNVIDPLEVVVVNRHSDVGRRPGPVLAVLARRA
jgi:hypothetical protein